MTTKLFTKIIALVLASIIGLCSMTTPVFADDYDICKDKSVAESVRIAAGCEGSKDALPGIIQSILNSIIAVAGLIAVIFIIIGGVNYMTSAGDPSKVKKARETILYAAIGLVVCVLAFAIVNFVIINILGQGQES